jgi:hypothetical protein
MRYFLVAGAAVVWGLIIYRVASALHDNDPKALSTRPASSFNYTTKADSFLLIADYPDPFIAAEYDEDTVQAVVDKNAGQVNVISSPVPSFDRSSVQYYGMIANRATRAKVASISIKGKLMLAKEKDEIEEFIIKKIENDRLVIVWKGEVVSIVRSEEQ